MQSKYYTDPFGNNTEYSYPDQYTVRQQGERFKGHTIYRAVESYAHSEAQSASRSVSVGHGFFKASVKVKHAQSVMSDGLHVVTGTKHQIGLYEIDLDPGFLLTLDDKLQRCLEYLPEEYDPARYEEFCQCYGTHYVAAVTLGGLGVMKTTLSQAYYSTTSDSSIQADLQATWDAFSGGASGSSSSHTASAKFQSNSAVQTLALGGDPAINQFSSKEEWTTWAESVKTGAPVTMSCRLAPIWRLIEDHCPSAQKHLNLNVNRSTYEQGCLVPVLVFGAKMVIETVAFVASLGSPSQTRRQEQRVLPHGGIDQCDDEHVRL